MLHVSPVVDNAARVGWYNGAPWGFTNTLALYGVKEIDSDVCFFLSCIWRCIAGAAASDSV